MTKSIQMNNSEFLHWLQGWFDLSSPPVICLSPLQANLITKTIESINQSIIAIIEIRLLCNIIAKLHNTENLEVQIILTNEIQVILKRALDLKTD